MQNKRCTQILQEPHPELKYKGHHIRIKCNGLTPSSNTVQNFEHLQQSCSSDLSLQSSSPSHFQFKWIHSPLPHWNSCAAQVLTICGLSLYPHLSMDSSERSSQSGCLSQTQICGMHRLLLHWNSFGLQVKGGHFLSSLPSPQSSSPSQTKIVAMQVLLLHWNSLEEQTLGGKTDKD